MFIRRLLVVLSLALVSAGSLIVEAASADQTTAVADGFSRTSTTTWGTATTGGTYTYEGASGGFATPTTYGAISFTAAGTARQASLASTSLLDTDVTVQITVSKKPVGGDVKMLLAVRQGADGSAYRGYLRIRPSGELLIGAELRQASGTVVPLQEAPVSIGAMTVSSYWKLRVWVSGASPSRIRVKAWKVSTQPATWPIDLTSSESGLQDSGFVGIGGEVESGVSNATTSSALKVLADGLTGLSGADTTPPTTPTVLGGGAAWGSFGGLYPRGTASTDTGGSGFAFYQSRTSRDAGSTWMAPLVGNSRTVREEGETLVQFRGVDWAGNASAWAPASGSSGTVRLDRTAPTGVVIAGGDAAWNNAASVAVAVSSASDPLSGLTISSYQKRTSTNGGATWSSPSGGASQTVTAVGETLVQFRVTDKAGNATAWLPPPGSSEATVRLDRTAPGTPTISSSSHADPGTTYAATTLLAAWTAPTDTSGIAGYGVVVDTSSSTVPSVVTQLETTIEATNQTTGTRYLHVRAKDGAGNWGATAHFAFSVSGSIGGVELLEPVEDLKTNGHVRLVARAPGSSAVRFEFRRFDDATWSVVPNSRLQTEAGAVASLPVAPGAGSVTPVLVWDAGATASTDSGVGENGLSGADAPFVVRAVDVASGTASPDHLIALDRRPPQLSFTTSPAAPTVLVGTTVDVSWATDEPVVGYSLSMDGLRDANSTPAVTTPPSTLTQAVTLASAGNRYVHVRGVDEAGNWTDPFTVEVAFRDGVVSSPAPASRLDGVATTMPLTQTLAGSGTGYICVQYQRPGSADWMAVPASSVTHSGTPIGSWPAAIPKGTQQTLNWANWTTAPEIVNNPGGIEVRTLTGGATTACDTTQTTTKTLATSDVFYAPAPTGGGGGGGGGDPVIGGADDAGRILYSYEASSNWEGITRPLLLAEADGGDAEPVSDNYTYVRTAAASDDASMTAFVRNDTCSDDDQIQFLGVNAISNLSTGGRVQALALSPDGSKLAYAVQTPSEFDCEEAVVGPGTMIVVDLTGAAAPRGFSGLSPVFLHDGSTYDVCWVDGTSLQCLDLDDPGAIPLTVRTDVMSGGRAFWTRDDKAVAYDAGTADAPILRIARNSAGVVGISGSGVATNDLADRLAGPWSPNGSLLATTRHITLGDDSRQYALETVDPTTDQLAAVLRSNMFVGNDDPTETFSTIKARVHAWPSRLDNVAATYRPYLRFDPSERWRPIDAEAMLQETVSGASVHRLCLAFERTTRAVRGAPLVEVKPNCDRIPNLATAPATSLDDQLQSLAEDDSVAPPVAGMLPTDRVSLQLEGSSSSDASPYHGLGHACSPLCDSDAGPSYYHLVTADGWLYVQYWWFYRFNDASLTIAGGNRLGLNHQGDWEGVTVAISDGVVPRVGWVAYSAHGHWLKYFPEDLAAHGALVGHHPVVNVASGTHANYPDTCSECANWYSLPFDIGAALHLGEAPHLGTEEYHLNAVPDAACLTSCVRDLDTTGVNSFPGRWGIDETVDVDSSLSNAPPSPYQQGPNNNGAQYNTPDQDLKVGKWN